ncbi:MAG: nucleotidyl transferase AbiEii/AbiGii toxin family protein [Candidatus Moraniibacteriota bacterium]
MLDKFFLEDYIKRNDIPNVPRRVLTEYLQTEILAILFNSKFGPHLSFLGGTCLRFVHKIERFSEDLDFDLIKADLDYAALAKFLQKKLIELGFPTDTSVKKTENIIIVNVKFSQVMKEMGLSELTDQKLKIKFEIDPTPYKNIRYESKQVFAYGKSFNIISNTLETLFAQKIIAIIFRPYQKGRDFYDLVWFLSQQNLEPNYAIFQEKNLAISNRAELIEFLKTQAQKSDLPLAVKDVERFLFYPKQAQWILKLPEYLEGFGK